MTGIAQVEDENEYVDLMIEVKDGQVVGCEFYGEGRQATPVTGLQFFKPLEGDEFPRGWKRFARQITRAFSRI